MSYIDKFYRLYPNTFYRPEGRTAEVNKSCLNFDIENQNWNALNYPIHNVQSGKNPSDAVTVSQILKRKRDYFMQGNTKYEFLESDNNNVWDAKRYKISNLNEAKEPNDAPIYSQILRKKGDTFIQDGNEYNFIELDKNGWNCKQKRITNLSNAKEPNDVPTYSQILRKKGDTFIQDGNEYNFMQSDGNGWNANKHTIKNLAPGVDNNDSVIMSQIPFEKPSEWDFKGKRIANISSAKNATDAVPRWQAIALDNNKFSAKNKQINDVQAGTLPTDVAIVDQLFKRVGGNVISANGKQFSVLMLDGNIWDGKNIRIANVQGGSFDNDVCIIKQLKNLKDYFPKLVVADTENGFKTLDGEVYKPNNFIYHNEQGNAISASGKHIKCPSGRISF